MDGNPELKRLLSKIRFGWEDITKYLVGSLRRLSESLDSIEVSRVKEHLWASVNIRVRFVLNETWIIVSFSMKILLHVVRELR